MLNRIVKKIRRIYITQKKHLQYLLHKKNMTSRSTKNQILPMVTIFGSCRQDSIYNLYPVTRIRNELTYTHYTKEVIQAIQYCLGNKTELNELVYFSIALLKGRLPHKNYIQDFNLTDVFVIEIASRIAYKYKSNYIHHEAYDNKNYHHLLDQPVEVTDLTDIEIENDLIKIRSLLHPKKILVVTHNSTKKSGRRYELVESIKLICKKLNIPVIDPSLTTSDYPENDVFLPNDQARHYTDFGHKLIEVTYKKSIDELAIKQPELVQTYTNDANKVSKHTAHGFGDFLMGSIYINQIAEKLNYEAHVSFNNHPLSNFFYNRHHVCPSDLEKVKYIFDAPTPIDFVNENLVFTNYQIKNIRLSDKQFLIKNCLTPRIKFLSEIEALKDKLNLGNNYSVLHIRSKDFEKISEKTLSKLQVSVLKQLKPNKKYLFLSNDQVILDRLCDQRLVKTQLGRCHSGESDINNEDLRDTLIEFMLMTKSQEIIQFSPYQWGSNFSNIIAKIYDIPLYKINYTY